MRHGWHSRARSLASPNACPSADRAARLPAAVTGAFVDRTPIDWTALLGRVRDPAARTALEALRHLDDLRGGRARVPLADRSPAVPLLAGVTLLGAAQAVCALGIAAAAALTSEPTGHLAPLLLLTVAFLSSGVLLGSASFRDRRTFLLMSTFVLVASAFARPVAASLPGHWPAPSSVLFRGLSPEAFALAALWRFAVVFPAVRRFTAFDVAARRAAVIAWGVAAFLFLVNLLIAYGALDGPLAVFGRDDRRNLFWHLFAVATVPAVATILVRSWRAPQSERTKVLRLAAAIGAGAAPFLLTGVARMLLPAVDRWMRAGSGAGRFSVDVMVTLGLAALPLLCTLAVVIDRPFELHAILPRIARGWCARTLWRLSDILQSRSLRRRTCRDRLTAALDRVRLARGPREVSEVIGRELRFGVGARSVAVLDPGRLPANSALIPMLAGETAPVGLWRDCEPFTLLPAADREWLEARGAGLAAAVRLRDGTIAAIVLLAPRRRDDRFDRIDRWFISTLLTGAAAAWDTMDPDGDPAVEAGDVAVECRRCGAVGDDAEEPCACRAGTRLAVIPRRIGGRFIVTRRLGAGGMGVVYLGRDLPLGREVALKTLPAVREDLVARLRREAQVMAALNHEALATIYSLEVWRRTPVLVVEFFPNGTLADRLARGPLPVGEVLALGLRLANALGYMHARGVLHRDLKPSNIGLTGGGVAKLFDFGLSAGDELAGTPAYLPPEALAGGPPNTAVDLWALSTVLLQACGGRERAGVLGSVLDRALLPAPDARFQSSEEIAAALLRLSLRSSPTYPGWTF